MEKYRGKIALGSALAVSMAGMIGLPFWISISLLLLGVFLLVWGIAPVQTRGYASRLPQSWGALEKLDKLDEMVEQVSGR